MSEPTTKDVVKTVVYSYDLSCMGIQGKLPDTFRDIELTDEQIAEHMPSATERAQAIAYQSCYSLFCMKNDNATTEDFYNTLTKEDFEKVTNHVLTKISPSVSPETIKEHLRVKFLNLTRVDQTRQVRFDK